MVTTWDVLPTPWGHEPYDVAMGGTRIHPDAGVWGQPDGPIALK